MEDGEDWDQKKIVSRRASWYFADSHPEREHIRCVLKDFYDQRSAIVHGNTPANLTWAEEGQLATLTADIENVARSSVKDMISAGRPQNWEDSKDPKLIRHDPPRRETEILSVKSDSMSWTVAEQKEIDHALEAIWKPDVDSAPPQPPDAVSSVYTGVIAEEIERCRQQGIPYVHQRPHPALLGSPQMAQAGRRFRRRPHQVLLREGCGAAPAPVARGSGEKEVIPVHTGARRSQDVSPEVLRHVADDLATGGTAMSWWDASGIRTSPHLDLTSA